MIFRVFDETRFLYDVEYQTLNIIYLMEDIKYTELMKYENYKNNTVEHSAIFLC